MGARTAGNHCEGETLVQQHACCAAFMLVKKRRMRPANIGTRAVILPAVLEIMTPRSRPRTKFAFRGAGQRALWRCGAPRHDETADDQSMENWQS